MYVPGSCFTLKCVDLFLQEKAMKSWFERNAESVELLVENNDSEEERVNNYKKKKISSMQLKKLQQVLLWRNSLYTLKMSSIV